MTELIKAVTKEEVNNKLMTEELNEYIVGINTMLMEKGKADCYFASNDYRVGDIAEYYRKAGWDIKVQYRTDIETVKLSIR